MINNENTNPSSNTSSSSNQQQQQQQIITQIDYNHETFQSWINQLVDSNSNEDQKLKSIQDLSLNLELMQTLPSYSQLIENAMRKFVRLLTETEPQFLSESSIHQLRKKALEILQRTHPFLNITQPQIYEERLTLVRDILFLIYQLLERENEENVILCLKIIIEFHRYLKNVLNYQDVQKYFQFVKNMYQDLAQNVNLVFKYTPQIKVHDLNELNVTQILNESYSSFQILTEKYNNKENQIFNLIPRGIKSLKVLAELPINTVTMYQNYKANLNQDIGDIIVLIANIIVLKPTEEQKLNLDLKEVIADFVTAQVRALSFIAYFKNHQDYLRNNSDLFVEGILQLFKNCPPELVSIRKDLLLISRHIISEQKQKFLPYISQFFDESTFCSTGYTASESLRSNACTIVVDLVHSVRKELSYQDLCKAINYFSKSLHDPLLYINLQHMCCKVLLSLIECIRTKDNAREFILKLLEVFVLKFKSIAKYQVAHLMESITSSTNSNQTNDTPLSNEKEEETQIDKAQKLEKFLNSYEDKDRIKLKLGPSSVIIQSETDIRTTIRFLILACRSITTVLLDTKPNQTEQNLLPQQKQLTSIEQLIYIKLLKHSLKSLDIYIKSKQINSNLQKEEKEVIENLGMIYTYLNTGTLKEIFNQTIEFIIERTFKNSNISILSSYFLATPATSCTFATILIEHLLLKIDQMGDSTSERSNLYLKLFKLVFGSVSVFPSENEKMLKPHLHLIVNRSLELALKSKEPHNYFLLLRALFRSIGGGNHDLLYQEFLPLLPILLQSLNELQTGLHKQYLKDLFVELCLTVPVRLSSLLPYLPMLMDPLVSALNGSTTLVSQGLRTLELCVDNLQPDFLYEHIQPVRTDLIHGLWKQLRSQNETIALAAYRVLGKLGGSNRKMIIEPQQLKYEENKQIKASDLSVKIEFIGYTGTIDINLQKCLEYSQNILKNSSNNIDFYYKKQAFKLVSSFLCLLIKPDSNQQNVYNFFNNFNALNLTQFNQYLIKTQKFGNDQLRKHICMALECLFYTSTYLKEMQKESLILLDSFVVYLTLLSFVPYNLQNEQKVSNLIQLTNVLGSKFDQNEQANLINNQSLDFMILIDSIFNVLCNDDIEYWPVVQRVLLTIIETSEIITGSSHIDYHEQADYLDLRSNFVNQALFDYLAEKVSYLCYERSWYAKKSGCLMINLLCKKMPLIWTMQQCYLFIRSIMFILVSVTGEISSGAIDTAQENLDILIKICFNKLNLGSNQQQPEHNVLQQLNELQQKALNDVLKELIKQITSPNDYVRKESIKLIRQISELQSRAVYNLIQPYSDVLSETVAPRKHLKLRHYSAQAQIGILEGLEFCSSTQPQLFTLQLSNPDHSSLYYDLIPICDNDDTQLKNLTCYKSITDLTPLKKTALNCLSSFYHLLEQREQILSTLHRSLASQNKEIQQTCFKCLKKYIQNTEAYSNQLRSQQQLPANLENLRQTVQIAADYLREYLHPLTEYTYLNQNVVQHLSYITQLYPTILNEKFSEYLLSHLKRWLDDICLIIKENSESPSNQIKPYSNEIQLCSSIISLLADLQSAPAKLVDTSISLILKYEKLFGLEVNCLFREPLSRFLKRYSFESLKYLLQSERMKDIYNFRFILYLVKKQPVSVGKIFKDESSRLIQMLNESKTLYQNGVSQSNQDYIQKSAQIQYLTILVIYNLIKYDQNNEWLNEQSNLIDRLIELWADERFHEKHRHIDSVDYLYWKEPIYMLKILLKFHKSQITTSQPSSYPLHSNIELLFQLLIVFQYKSINQFEFLRLYFTEQVSKTYSNEIKRVMFFTFVRIFTEPDQPAIYTQKLKSNILQYILIPSFQYSFEQNQHSDLIGGPPQPDQDSPDNIISVFINRVVDPDQPYANSDSVRIFLLQLSSLFVQYAHDYIHDVNNKRQGNKLRRLMTFAWPCLLAKTCVDPFNKYHGLLLLSHIISKFAIHKRIVLQVFHSLLKAYAPEAKIVVRQALEILTPSFPTRSEDGYVTLASWTKKILIEENHSIPQLSHLIYIIVKYYKVFYYIRHSLINQLIVAFQKVGLNSTPENRSLIIDLSETILRWEAQRIKDSQSELNEALLQKHPDLLKPFDKHIADSILNFFIRYSCQTQDQTNQQNLLSNNANNSNTNESLSKRCLDLFKTAIQNDLLQNADLKLDLLERLMLTLESTYSQNPLIQQILSNQINQAQLSQTQPNYSQISICIDIITILIENSNKNKIQTIFKSIQKGLTCCLTSINPKIVKSLSKMIQKLMSIVPAECFNNIQSASNEQIISDPASLPNEPIYQLFGQPDGILCRTIIEGMSYYEKSTSFNVPPDSSSITSLNSSIDILNNCLTLLKSASIHNPQYIDRLMGPIMKILQKLYRDHLNWTGTNTNSNLISLEGSNLIQAPNSVQIYSYSELLIQSIDLIKNRVGVMSLEMRRAFINQTLISLIEKSADLRLVKYLIKLINEWVQTTTNSVLVNQIPSLKEKLILLQKLTQCVEKRFNNESSQDIQKLYLEIIVYVYSSEFYMNNQEFKIKLEQAFLIGLKSSNFELRKKFFDLFNKNFQSNDLYERLCFIIVSLNWEMFGNYYWIKPCINLTLGQCFKPNLKPQLNEKLKFASLTTDIDSQFNEDSISLHESIIDLNLSQDYSKKILNIYNLMETDLDLPKRSLLIDQLVKFVFKFYDYSKSIKTNFLIDSLCELCHLNTELSHSVWQNIFLKFFTFFNDKQKLNLLNELTPFLASGSHCVQKNTNLSVLNTFIETISNSKQIVSYLRPSLLGYLAKNHNLWHRSILIMENLINDSDTELKNESFSTLNQLLTQLKEEDLKSGLWYKKSSNDQTRLGLVYEQQGLFYQSQKLFEESISRCVENYLNDSSASNREEELLEFSLWEEKWVKCCKELNQWNELNDYVQTKDNDITLQLECAWKLQQNQTDWSHMKNLLLSQKESNLPKDQAWKWYLYQGYYLVCNPDDYHHLMLATSNNLTSVFSVSSAVESKVEKCMLSALKEWRRLPKLVTPSHMCLLQAAQQIIELQEAFQIQNSLQTLNQSINQTGQLINQGQVSQEIKGIIKTWRARLPLINDDLSYWNDIFTWRQFHYESFSKFYEKHANLSLQNANPSMLGVHALAQGIVNFGKIARKQHLYDLCLETLNKIHKKQSVPIIDCFLKVKQEIKCYINTFEYLSPKQSQEILDLIEATNLRYFTKENVAELISLKANFLQLTNRYDDANNLYSFSIYLNDSQPKLWGAWGDYLTQAYVDVTSRSGFATRSIETAESAIIALLHAARHQGGEAKTRKYISKILWLLSYDNEKRQLFSQFDNYSSVIPAQNWIPWIPQLISLLMKNDDSGKYLINLMLQIIRQYPLALYYPLRTLYLKLKNDEQTEKIKQQILQQQQKQQQSQDVEMKDLNQSNKNQNTTAESLIRVTTLMHRQREMHPTLFNTLEGLIDQLLTLKCNWYEELLRNFKQTLNYVYTYVYEANFNKKSDFIDTIDPFSIMWFKKIHKFYVDPQFLQLSSRLNNNNNLNQQSQSPQSVASPLTPSSSTTSTQSSSNMNNNNNCLQNQRLRGLIAILNDPNYQSTRVKFSTDFNYQQSQPVNVYQFIDKLKQWIKLIESHLDLNQPKKQLLDERFKFVTQFCSSTADIELPGEHLIPRLTNYYVKISRFLPWYESVEKYQSYSRRISIRGHNGKVYPFLILNESAYFYECRKEEHISQIMRMINTYLNKQKETSSRCLNFMLPRMVSLSAECRMIEDDFSSISFLDVLKPKPKKNSLDFYFKDLAKPKLALFKEIQSGLISKNLFKEWALRTYDDATDYFHFRKLFTQQLSLYNLIEYVLNLTKINPDQFYVHKSNGVLQSIRFKFDLMESNGSVIDLNHASKKLVPFRLTPNIVEFIQSSGIYGVMSAVMISLSRCLVQPQYHFVWLLRAILKDEILNFIIKKKQEDLIKNNLVMSNNNNIQITQLNQESEQEYLVNLVNKLVDSIEKRLKDCASLENGRNLILNELMPKALNLDNLSEMDPLWYPWL